MTELGTTSQLVMNLSQKRGDLYKHLFALGRSPDGLAHRSLVATFLEHEEDAMVARLALQILCRWWGLYRDYKIQILRFLHPVDWDAGEMIRLIAIGCAGELFLVEGDDAVLVELYRIFRCDAEDPVIRDAAYAALARAMGTPAKELPPASRLLRPEDLSLEVLASVRKRLSLDGP
ncbi:hypothetical protein ACNOYE_21115 [Nannocystaceae bacterium ST9]